MIELGLARISQLIKHTPLKWRAIHVAGTNGKGTVTAYLSALLKEGGILTGRFTSPHLIDRWDCISVNESTVSESLFKRIEDEVKTRNREFRIGASEFELLTATAFEIFNRERVSVGVVEVGLGGRLDATNVLDASDVIVSIITKIGLDHQNLLGTTLEAIATEKGGIIKQGVPIAIDGTNDSEVLDALRICAARTKSPATVVTPESSPDVFKFLKPYFGQLDMDPHQRANLLLAVHGMALAHKPLQLAKPLPDLLHVIPYVQWHGRLQMISIEKLTRRQAGVLLDGAHNLQSAEVLSAHVDRKLRYSSEPVTWVLAASKGKNVQELVGCLVKPGDNVIAAQFGSVDGMPWVKSVNTTEIIAAANDIDGIGQVVPSHSAKDTLSLLKLATEIAGQRPLVIAGSLYLVSDVLHVLRDGAHATVTEPQ